VWHIHYTGTWNGTVLFKKQAGEFAITLYFACCARVVTLTLLHTFCDFYEKVRDITTSALGVVKSDSTLNVCSTFKIAMIHFNLAMPTTAKYNGLNLTECTYIQYDCSLTSMHFYLHSLICFSSVYLSFKLLLKFSSVSFSVHTYVCPLVCLFVF
jgi:hypothetical protein